jgi:hypothetical protein
MASLRPYQKAWSESQQSAAIFASALAQARFAVGSPDLIDVHRRGLINQAIWQVTGSEGKYTTRYRSRGVLELEASGPVDKWWSQLRHEHVVTRASLTRRILEGEDPATVLADAVACIVTIDEHRRLSVYDKSHYGWERYRLAGIEVIDMEDGTTFDLAPGGM